MEGNLWSNSTKWGIFVNSQSNQLDITAVLYRLVIKRGKSRVKKEKRGRGGEKEGVERHIDIPQPLFTSSLHSLNHHNQWLLLLRLVWFTSTVSISTYPQFDHSDGLKVTAVSNEGLVSDNRRTKNGKFTMAQLRQTDGIVPLQYGTNQFSSQAVSFIYYYLYFFTISLISSLPFSISL